MSREAEAKPGARLVTLLKRARFELRLAADIAAVEGDDLQLRALIAGARGNLRRALRRVEESVVSNLSDGGDHVGS